MSEPKEDLTIFGIERTPLEMAKHIIECENSFDRYPAEAVVVAREFEKKIAECENYRQGLEDALGALPNEYCELGDIIKKALGVYNE